MLWWGICRRLELWTLNLSGWGVVVFIYSWVLPKDHKGGDTCSRKEAKGELQNRLTESEEHLCWCAPAEAAFYWGSFSFHAFPRLVVFLLWCGENLNEWCFRSAVYFPRCDTCVVRNIRIQNYQWLIFKLSNFWLLIAFHWYSKGSSLP